MRSIGTASWRIRGKYILCKKPSIGRREEHHSRSLVSQFCWLLSLSVFVVCDSLWYAELPTSVTGLEAARVFRGRIYMLLHAFSNGGTAARLYALLRNIHVLAACFVVRMNYGTASAVEARNVALERISYGPRYRCICVVTNYNTIRAAYSPTLNKTTPW
jgi:hypothetical protein